jgi:hypothetical protein
LAIRSLYDAIGGSITGFGAGLRTIMDYMFELDLEMFHDYPEEVWIDPTAWQVLTTRYVQAVMEGSVATDITFGGELTEEAAEAIRKLAQEWVGKDAVVHTGLLRPPRSILQELSAVASIAGGVAAVISLCVQLLQLRRQAHRPRTWTSDELRANLEHELAHRGEESCEVMGIEDFNEPLAADGDLCRVVLRDTVTGHEYDIHVSTRAATWSLYVVRRR